MGLNLTYLIRNDISGALTNILENAPYGPNVDEAKVRMHPPPLLELIPPFAPLNINRW